MERVVGRAEHIAAGLESLSRGISVVVYGPAGVGKTTVARTMVDAMPGRTVLWNSVTHAAASVALGPLASLVAVAGAEHQQPVELLAGVGTALQTKVPDAVVVVDDAHLLDDLSAAVVRTLVDSAIPIVVTVRSGEPVPDAIEALWMNGRAKRLEINALGADAVAELVAVLLGGDVGGDTAARIFELSGGVPLLVREIVLAGRASGWLQPDGHRWSAADRPLPCDGRLRDLIRARLRDCPPDLIDALELVAVAEKIELDALSSIVSLDAVVALEDRKLVRVIEGPTHVLVTVDHPIIAEVVRHELGEVRQRVHADRLVRGLTVLASRDRDRALRIGELTARSTAPNPDLLLGASTAANTIHDFTSAARFARIASSHGGGVRADLVWAEAANNARDFSAAEAVARRLLATPGLTSAERASATIMLARVLMWGLGHADEAEGLLRSVVVDDLEPQQLLDVELAFLLITRGDADRTIGICEPLVDSGVSIAVRLRAAASLASGYSLKGAVDTVSALVADHMDAAIAHADLVPRAAAELTGVHLIARYLAGDAIGSERDAAALVQMAEEMQNLELEAVGQLLLALALQARGHVDDAIVAMDRAIDLLTQHDAAQLSGWAHAARAHLASVAGDLASSEHHLNASLVPPHNAFTTYDFDRTMARARAHAYRGDRQCAIDEAISGAAEMRALGKSTSEASFLDLASRLGYAVAADRLSELALEAEGPLVPLMAEHAQALAARDPDRLIAVATALEEIGYDLSAADAAADATRTALSQGRSGTAAALAQRAAALLERCGVDTFTRPLPASDLALDLTERELEVALLAAHGLTNKEIAERLSLSRRTVGNHLYRAYAKAGVEGRLGLADVLRAAGHLRDLSA